MWFDETFLPSLLTSGRERWISAKQVNVCVQYMEHHVMRDEDGKHHYYTYTWKGYRVVLTRSSLNGAGRIVFHIPQEPDYTPNFIKRKIGDAKREIEYWTQVCKQDEEDGEDGPSHQVAVDHLHEAIKMLQKFQGLRDLIPT